MYIRKDLVKRESDINLWITLSKKLSFFREMKFSELEVIKNMIRYSEDLRDISLCSGLVDWIIHRHAGIGQEISKPTEF